MTNVWFIQQHDKRTKVFVGFFLTEKADFSNLNSFTLNNSLRLRLVTIIDDLLL